jgi:DNA-binding response OmpR family regulator
VAAFHNGADAYLVKPIRRRELLARLDAIVKRTKRRTEQPAILKMGAYHVDLLERVLMLQDRPVELTPKDFDLFVMFLLNIGRLLTRAEIRDNVWGHEASITSRTVETHVSRIRSKLALTPDNGWHLTAVYGHGYRLQSMAAMARLQKHAVNEAQSN